MKSVALSFAASMVALMVWACSGDRISGNTTQTENTLARILVDSVLPDWNHPTHAATVATLKLDSSNFDFRLSDPSGRDLTVEKDSGQPIPFNLVFWNKPGRLGRLQVRLDTSLLHPGSHFIVRWKQPIQTRSNPTAVWQSIPDSQRLALGSVLVDDFEGTSTKSKLPDGASWYSIASDSTVTVSSPALVAAGAGRTGKAIHITYNAPGYKYSLIGIVVGSNGAPRNFRSLDSLVFWAKGSGNMGIAYDRLPPHSVGKSWTHRLLDTAWTRIRLRPQDMDTIDNIGNNIGWNAVCDSVTNLTFLVSGGSNLYVDDIRLYGMDRDDLK